MRREKGTGYVPKRPRPDGTFRGYITLPRLSDDKQRRLYVTGKTKSDVKAEILRLQALQLDGKHLETRRDRTTVASYLTAWAAGKEAAPKTRKLYQHIVARYLVGSNQPGCFKGIGGLLTELDGGTIVDFLRRLRDADPGDRTRQQCFDILRAALNAGIATGQIQGNPLRGCERPRAVRREVTPWMLDEVDLILAAAKNDRFFALYVMEFSLGLQFPGEVFGLRWDLDVDMQHRTVRVGGQAVKGHREPTKTKARRRELAMPDDVHAALSEHRKRLLSEGLRSSTYVFPNQSGEFQSPRNFVRDSFDVVVARAGVRRLRPYDMRHTFATLALAAGVHIKTVSRMLGHASEVETLRTYSHFIPSQIENANAQLAAYRTRPRTAAGAP